ncbi:MAG TPA: hypothetical protein VNX21_00150 [Candidatus Thermoplasmatota archaeon]|nr:hypothetical protein [Candidatus Thermoplasmatota archaeon]
MRILVPLLALALLSTGCIANMADLKEKVQPAAAQEPEPLQPAAVAPPAANLTPPVARIQVFGANGGLLYKADFKADNVTAPLVVPAGVELTFLSGDSAAVAPGATVAKAAWRVGNQTLEGAKATATLPGPGLYPLVLTVTDTQGATDQQALALGVMPDPFEVAMDLTAGPVFGANGQGQGARLAFALNAALAGKPATIQGVKVVASAPATCDVTLALLDGEGEPIAEVNDADATSGDQTETLDAGALPEGGYALALTPNACLARDGFPVQVVVTFLEVVPGLTDAAGDGHGGHAH